MSSGREVLQDWKTNPQRTIPVGEPVQAVLRPVATAEGTINPEDVRALTAWRNRFVTSFLTQFEATEERTARWLKEVVGPDPDRILFMLDDTHGRTIGYLGLAFIEWEERTGEADHFVRGVDDMPGIMKKAAFALFRWAHRELGLTSSLTARIRWDNPSLPFFLKISEENKRVPLRAIDEPDMRRWVEDESLSSSPAGLVYITFRRELYDVD
jgi:RimJ/RimL family protein N-acetyltransferase